jgi:hypothetical protein
MTEPPFIRRLGAAAIALMMCGILGAPVLADTFYDNIFAVPAAPTNVFAGLFVTIPVLGIAGFAALKFGDPVAAERAGTYAEDSSSNEQNQE